jgi:hypothetical protein
MTADASQIADRRAQWAQLTPQQQMQRVQYALLDFQDHAIRRRQQARRRTEERLHQQRRRRPWQVREYDPL